MIKASSRCHAVTCQYSNGIAIQRNECECITNASHTSINLKKNKQLLLWKLIDRKCVYNVSRNTYQVVWPFYRRLFGCSIGCMGSTGLVDMCIQRSSSVFVGRWWCWRQRDHYRMLHLMHRMSISNILWRMLKRKVVFCKHR